MKSYDNGHGDGVIKIMGPLAFSKEAVAVMVRDNNRHQLQRRSMGVEIRSLFLLHNALKWTTEYKNLSSWWAVHWSGVGKGHHRKAILFFNLEAHHGPLLGSFQNWMTNYTNKIIQCKSRLVDRRLGGDWWYFIFTI